LAFVLTASALKLLNVGTVELAVILSAALVAGPLVWRFVRATGGLRRGWKPAPGASAEDFSGGGAAVDSADAAVIPLSATRPAAGATPVRLASQGH
jgi:hypothetical protein